MQYPERREYGAAAATTEAPTSEGANGFVLDRALMDVTFETFRPGVVIANRYEVIRFIARGGMGEVYEAEDLELGTRVAVKTIRAERTNDPRSVERLKREILMARRVTHAHVVRLHDVGFHLQPDQREIAFITMDLLEGETLEAYRRRCGRLPLGEALTLVTQLAGALDAAHAAGVVHRDFKSQNVMLENRDGLRAVVTDFGLADAGVEHDAGMPALAGTPAYMAPEQVSRREPVTKAADIYALGVVMFEMVTGQLPFVGDTPHAMAMQRLELPPLEPRSLVPGLPAVWNATILRCLERDPARRFASGAAIVEALAGRRRRTILALGLGLAALAAGVAAFSVATHAPAAAAHACDAPTGPDIWVDARAPAGGTGSTRCPLRTITAALALPAATKRVHVARGTYNRELGEDFPLIVRGEVAIVGAGRERTAIVGSGRFDTRPAGGTMSENAVVATFVAGDTSARIEIAELSLRPDAVDEMTSFGVLCTRGNSARYDTPMLPPNTILRNVAIGPKYDTGVIVATELSPVATGCNLRLEGSTVAGGFAGVWALGAGGGTGRVATGVAVVDSELSGMEGTARVLGTGVRLWDCVRDAEIRGSIFSNSEQGVEAIRHADAPAGRLRIEDSRFNMMSHAAIALARAIDVERISGNRFIHIAAPASSPVPAPAIRLAGVGGELPSITARDNVFLQGDLGVLVTSSDVPDPRTRIDLGRPDAPGNNYFVCNSRPVEAAGPGGDVAVSLPHGAALPLSLSGNRWDHAPPTIGHEAVNGLDIRVPRHSKVSLDVSAARATGGPCNVGVAGPK